MRENQTPSAFETRKSFNGHTIEYHDLFEICQGGPEVGTISIDGVPLNGRRIGGPNLISERYLFVPEHIRKPLLGFRFHLLRVDLETLETLVIPKSKKEMIFLKRIEDRKIFFCEDVSETIVSSLDLPE